MSHWIDYVQSTQNENELFSWHTEVIVQSDSTPFLWKLPYLDGEFLDNVKVNKKVKSRTWTSNQGQEERKEEQDTV